MKHEHVVIKDDAVYERCPQSAYGDPHHWVPRLDGRHQVGRVSEPRYVQECSECKGRLRMRDHVMIVVPQFEDV